MYHNLDGETEDHFDLDCEANEAHKFIESSISLVMKKGHISDQRQLLIMVDTDIACFAGLTIGQALLLKHHIAAQVQSDKPRTALEMLEDVSLRPWRLSTGCPNIDSILKGGFLSGVLTEVSGESACGKTQLCLQLCLSVQLQSNGGGAVYICTEDVFPSKRLQQMIKLNSNKSQRFGDNIFIEHVADFESLDMCVENRLPTLLTRGIVRLVVIDSVAALFRCHYTAAQSMERAQHLTRFAGVLHRLAAEHNIPIICVNQVSANMGGLAEANNYLTSLTPALGLTWANQVSCRVMMSKPRSFVQDEGVESTGRSAGLSTHRRLSVVFASHLQPTSLDIYIDNAGISGVSADVGQHERG